MWNKVSTIIDVWLPHRRKSKGKFDGQVIPAMEVTVYICHKFFHAHSFEYLKQTWNSVWLIGHKWNQPHFWHSTLNMTMISIKCQSIFYTSVVSVEFQWKIASNQVSPHIVLKVEGKLITHLASTQRKEEKKSYTEDSNHSNRACFTQAPQTSVQRG